MFTRFCSWITALRSSRKPLKSSGDQGKARPDNVIMPYGLTAFEMELLQLGHAERVNICPPGAPEGTDFIIMHYFDRRGRYTTKAKCKRAVVKACRKDGTMLQETFLTLG